ncbi:hypothetical protein [Psychroserpens algicola]|uniref:Uncharacterized protein n=1 Tax=Psychroserpens algicola TaxID=1719034 RepID=A0ABT0H5S9_9FLAO|nr:hypothetical protein [Psychroserpens algicola]MCK8479744.1 hypothetical protein [Psychroserpens algicola]
MKKLFFILLFLGLCINTEAQDQPKVGDVLEINEPYAQKFNHVYFPKANILIKRGKVANYNSVYGNAVVVSEIKTKDDGTTYVILKKKDGSKFFGYLSEVKANYKASLEAGELSISK